MANSRGNVGHLFPKSFTGDAKGGKLQLFLAEIMSDKNGKPHWSQAGPAGPEISAMAGKLCVNVASVVMPILKETPRVTSKQV